MSYEEEDTCHTRRRIHVVRGGGYMTEVPLGNGVSN